MKFSNPPDDSNDHNSTTVIAQGGLRNGMPRITVAISLYNYSDLIVSALESIESQTVQNLDLIVVDDCSTDRGLEVVRNWLTDSKKRFNRYVLLHHRSNRGLAAARNTGFANAQSEYVFVLDADNQLYPRCLEQLELALGNCDASFAYCYLERFGDESGIQNTKPWNAHALSRGNTIDAMALIRKNVWEQLGGYTENEYTRLGWEDYDFWFKLARLDGWGVLIPEILARYRVHQGSMLRQTTNPNAAKLQGYLRTSYPEFFSPND